MGKTFKYSFYYPITLIVLGLFVQTTQKVYATDDSSAISNRGSNLDVSNNTITDSTLKDVAQDEIYQDGITSSTMGAFAIAYSAISNLILYPIFSFLFLIFAVISLIIIVMLVKQYMAKNITSVTKHLLVLVFTLLLLIDTGLIAYEKKKVVLLFFNLQKDILFMIIACLVGFFAGKMYSKTSFEENVVP